MKRAAGSPLDRLSLPAKMGLSAALVALTAVFYLIIFYSDIDKQISQAQQEETNLQGQLASAKESQEAYQSDLDEKARRQQLQAEQKKILPDEAETPSFLSAVQNVATVAGVNLTAYSPVDEEPLEFYAKVPMSLTASGKFHQIVKFFHGVGQLDRIINLENIAITMETPKGKNKDDDVSNETLVRVECLATAFRKLNEEDQAAGGGRQRGRNRGPKK